MNIVHTPPSGHRLAALRQPARRAIAARRFLSNVPTEFILSTAAVPKYRPSPSLAHQPAPFKAFQPFLKPSQPSCLFSLLCKNKNRVVAEYALRDANRPIGISKYELTSALSEEWKSSLPSVEDIERELSLENDCNEEGDSREIQ